MLMSYTILVVDDEENTRINLEGLLTNVGYSVITAGSLAEARTHIQKGEGDIVLLDLQLPDGYGPNLLIEMSTMAVRPPVIMITGMGDVQSAVDAMKNGAVDFLEKPVDFPSLEKSIKRAIDLVSMRRELDHLRSAQMQDKDFVVGSTKIMKDIVDLATKAASMRTHVLLTGETGTGKDVLANYMYRVGTRSSKMFVPINCAAIQNTMLESELFGYEAGAFTGAQKRKPGLLEVADEGILFLDEISSMPLDIQPKVLRAIDTQAFKRVGGTVDVKVDVQIIAASNRDLQKMIRENQFREDLYYRLQVVEINVPPLRERMEDIPELVGYFIQKKNLQKGMNVKEITPRALEVLKNYSWPGNIRELSNTIERAMLFCDGMQIDTGDLSADIINYVK
jgi:two-component system, NtrC family, response regulator AtoC